jgi:glycosyltransferase involved in cell wall biosynthesis
VRRLVNRTGIDRLIAAAGAVRTAVPGVRILIAGDGPERAAYEAQIAAAGLGDTVRLLGFVPEETLRLAYRAATVTVVPTIALEGFGLIVPESLAAGTPVLVTPVGGLPETVRALDASLVLRDSSSEAIAAGLIAVLSGRQAMPDAAQCTAFAREHYDWPQVTAHMADLFRGIVAARSVGAA